MSRIYTLLDSMCTKIKANSDAISSIQDYVVEMGTASSSSISNWIYRKYNSGIVEMWGTTPSASIVCNNSYGVLYKSNAINYYLPFTLVSDKTYFAVSNLANDDGDGVYFEQRSFYTDHIMGHYYCPRNMTTPAIRLFIYAIGYYK